jgi:hypothetical protein
MQVHTCTQLALSILLLLAACDAGADAERAADRERIDTLERELRRLTDMVGGLKTAVEKKPAAPPPTAAAHVPRAFSLLCPGEWRELGAVGDALWACHGPKPQADGTYPTCVLEFRPQRTEWEVKDYFESAVSAVPARRSVKNFKEEPVVIKNQTGYSARFDHIVGTAPIKNMAAVLVKDDDAYLISCGATADMFASVEPLFRSVIESFEFKQL